MKGVAAEFGVDYETFLEALHYIGRTDEEKLINIVDAMEWEYKSSVQTVYQDVYDYYEVALQFNGEDCSESGKFNFRFFIQNKDGGFEIVKGLQWVEAYPIIDD